MSTVSLYVAAKYHGYKANLPENEPYFKRWIEKGGYLKITENSSWICNDPHKVTEWLKEWRTK